jgi:small-conductance mechanosensitive channel/CRP-like cAMP-binding protein
LLLVALAFLGLTLAIRAASVNRNVRSRLRVSALVFLVYVAGSVSLLRLPLSTVFAAQVATALPLLFAFALINVVVAVTFNPWREGRASDPLPRIVQDAVVIAIFALAAGLLLQEKIFAMGAVAAVVLGFALQDTLGNLLAGLAIQTEKPFRVGEWVTISGRDGLVVEITWRATKIRTKTGTLVIVPNNVLARDTIVNYSEPPIETRIDVEIPTGYEPAPNDVKAAILAAIAGAPMILRAPAPDVLIGGLSSTHVTYRVRAWIASFALEEEARDRVLSLVQYEFRRRGILPPMPMMIQYTEHPSRARTADEQARLIRVVRGVDIFAPLSDEGCSELVKSAADRLYAAGETIVSEGASGSSLFVVCGGEARVTVGTPPQDVARLGTGQYFGEMSLLTGDPRSATVSAVTDCTLLEIQAEDFRRLALADPMLVERIGVAVAERQVRLNEQRAAIQGLPAAPEPSRTLLSRVRRFLRL